MNHEIFITAQALVAAVAWVIVASGACYAVFAPTVKDTPLERTGLSMVAISALGTAFRIIHTGTASDGTTALAVSLALYVAACAPKYLKGCHHVRKC